MHFLSLKDLPKAQILDLLRSSLKLKQLRQKVSANLDYAPNATPLNAQRSSPAEQYLNLSGKTLAMIFTKKSTRTRVSAETGWASFGGHPLFLSHNDIQTSGGEALQDTSRVISSMADLILARVGDHHEIETLAKYSSVPVINALTSKFHPLQILADLMTIVETYAGSSLAGDNLLDRRLKVAWVGDANNIVNSMIATYPRLGLDLSVATPKGYSVESDIADLGANMPGTLDISHSPQQAVKDADVIVTDTWISMGQETEKKQRMADFHGFQVTEGMAGHANPDWKFMHCLPRKPQEVDDQVFYNPERSLVFQEAENRKYTVMAVFQMLMKQTAEKQMA